MYSVALKKRPNDNAKDNRSKKNANEKPKKAKLTIEDAVNDTDKKTKRENETPKQQQALQRTSNNNKVNDDRDGSDSKANSKSATAQRNLYDDSVEESFENTIARGFGNNNNNGGIANGEDGEIVLATDSNFVVSKWFEMEDGEEEARAQDEEFERRMQRQTAGGAGVGANDSVESNKKAQEQNSGGFAAKMLKDKFKKDKRKYNDKFAQRVLDSVNNSDGDDENDGKAASFASRRKQQKQQPNNKNTPKPKQQKQQQQQQQKLSKRELIAKMNQERESLYNL